MDIPDIVMTLIEMPIYVYIIIVSSIVVVLTVCKSFQKWKLNIPSCTIFEDSESGERRRIIKANRVFHDTMKMIRWHMIRNERSVAIDIHSRKYEGSSNEYEHPTLCINDFDDSDEGFYRLEVQYQNNITEYSNKVELRTRKDPNAEHHGFSIKKESDLYIGRDICLVAVSTMKKQNILSVLWHKQTSEKTTAIDISESKYKGSSLQGSNPVLRIKSFSFDDTGEYFFTYADEWGTYESSKFHADIEEGPPLSTIKGPNRALTGSTIRIMAVIKSFPQQNTVKWLKDGEEIELDEARMQYSIKRLSKYESHIDLVIKSIKSQDEGTYSLKVSNKKGDEDSNIVNLEVLGDCPEITLKRATQTGKYGESVTFTAVVKSEPKISSFRWIKKAMKRDNIFLDLNRQKYESKLSGENVTFTIQNLQFHDEGEYKLQVSNAVASCESGWLSVKVTGDIAIMISGPTLLFPKGRIEFLGCPLKQIAIENGFWTKDGNEIDIDGEEIKYRGSSKNSKEPKLFILDATIKDSGTYRFQVGQEISNEVYVSVSEDALESSEYENNFLRFYQLVILATEALRIKLKDLVPDLQTMLADIKDKAEKFNYNTKLLYPGNFPVTNPRGLDVSLLYKLLRHHTLIDRPKEWDKKFRTSRNPKDDTFKDPKTCDRNDGGNVERILRHRNKICHVHKLKLKTSTFNTDWLDLATVLFTFWLIKNV